MVLPVPAPGQAADVAAATRSSQEQRRAEAQARVQAYAARFAEMKAFFAALKDKGDELSERLYRDEMVQIIDRPPPASAAPSA